MYDIPKTSAHEFDERAKYTSITTAEILLDDLRYVFELLNHLLYKLFQICVEPYVTNSK